MAWGDEDSNQQSWEHNCLKDRACWQLYTSDVSKTAWQIAYFVPEQIEGRVFRSQAGRFCTGGAGLGISGSTKPKRVRQWFSNPSLKGSRLESYSKITYLCHKILEIKKRPKHAEATNQPVMEGGWICANKAFHELQNIPRNATQIRKKRQDLLSNDVPGRARIMANHPAKVHRFKYCEGYFITWQYVPNKNEQLLLIW